jgi:type 1 fimbria pilin
MSFNFKNNSAACAVAAALLAASWGAHAVDPTPNPGQATVKFTATVTDQTCTPEWKSTGSVGSALPFSLKLKDCVGVTGVTVRAGGTADMGYATAFANTTTGATAAKNVGFVLMGGAQQDTVLVPNDDTSTVEYKMPSTTDGDNPTYATELTLPFLAELVATADTATAGPAAGEATLYMTYE